MHAWIGLGSNIGDGPRNITEALARIKALPGVRLLRSSPLYRSEPWGDRRQATFTNAVAELASEAPPLELLRQVQAVEIAMGRLRDRRRWGPRRIDIDILLLGERILVLPDLVVPHPRLHRRRFVLLPLVDLEPDLVIPARGRARVLLARLSGQEVARI